VGAREFRKIALERLRELCATEKNSSAKRALFLAGIRNEIPFERRTRRLRGGAAAPDLAGTRYRLLERIARGGMGVVYAAEDDNLQRAWRLKVLDIPGTDGDLANRLLREARVLAALEHPASCPFTMWEHSRMAACSTP